MIFNETFFENNQQSNSLLYIRQAGVVNADESYMIEREGSETNVIGYVVSGTLIEKNNGKKTLLQQGDCFLLPYDTKYKISADKKNPPIIKWLNIRGGLILNMIDGLFGRGNIIYAPVNIEKQFDKISKLIKNKSDEFHEISKLTFDMMMSLHSAVRVGQKVEQDAVQSLTQIYDNYICSNIQHKFSACDMAAHLGVSTDTLNRKFKQQFGITPYRYYQNIRISLSESLLQNTQLTIEDIAARLNFIDRNYFSLYFKRMTGFSPAQYRKMKQLNCC